MTRIIRGTMLPAIYTVSAFKGMVNISVAEPCMNKNRMRLKELRHHVIQ